MGQRVELNELDAWCRAWLGAPVQDELFRVAHLSTVVGLRLFDGFEVVVKVRRPAVRLDACHRVRVALHEAGFPCPRPVLGPTPLRNWAATVEAYLPGGDPYPPTGRAAAPFADALASMIRLAPDAAGLEHALAPKPPWNAWDHDGDGLWPRPDDWDGDLDAVGGPPWIDQAADAARRRLAARRGGATTVVGHGDWHTDNLRWEDGRLHAVHDWDSVIADREPVVVGFAAAVFAGSTPGDEPTVAESESFVAAYQAARGVRFSEDDVADAWAAGLWLRAFDAKKQVATGETPRSLTEGEAAERRARFA